MVSGRLSASPNQARARGGLSEPATRRPAAGSCALVWGEENSLARAVAEELVEATPRWRTVLWIGPPGSGKSLLLNMLAAQRRRQRPGRGVTLTNGADFARAYAAAVQADGVREFRRKLRRAELLAVDDVHQLAGKLEAQVELGATVDALERRGAMFWAAAPSLEAVVQLAPGLASRLSAGLHVPLRPPQPAVRRRLAAQWAAELGQRLADDVLDLLAGAVGPGSPWRDLAGLRHALLQLDAEARQRGRPIDMDLARRLLQREAAGEQPTARKIASAVARRFRIPTAELRGPSRRREVVRARGLAMWLARRLTASSLQQIGRQFGGRDHTTVLHACRTTERLLREDPALRRAVRQLTVQLGGEAPAPPP